eukprot:3693193-Ditylum_brightwellii.AAC.1
MLHPVMTGSFYASQVLLQGERTIIHTARPFPSFEVAKEPQTCHAYGWHPDQVISVLLIILGFADDKTKQVNDAPYIHCTQPDTTLRIKQTNTGESVQIKYKSVYDPHKTLFHYKAPARDSIAQKNVLPYTDKMYACKVMKSLLTWHESWMYPNSSYLELVVYILG